LLQFLFRTHVDLSYLHVGSVWQKTGLVDDKLPAIEMVRKAVCEKIGKFTKSEIMELVPSLSKASVENSLTKLMKDGVVDRHGKGKATFYTRTDV